MEKAKAIELAGNKSDAALSALPVDAPASLKQYLRNCSKEALAECLALADFSPVYREADRVRREAVGDAVHLRAILEFSNCCARSCRYCGLNCGNKNVQRYRMAADEIIETACMANAAGYRTLVLQSGEDGYFTPDVLGRILRRIKEMTTLSLTVSCGEMSKEAYAYLRECGADRYLLKHETAAAALYASLHPCGTLEDRIRCLRDIKALGYETGSGFMIGLPGQTLDIVAEDLLLLKALDCDMAGIGPFIPHPDTPLGGGQAGSAELTKRAVALARILIPKCHLPATTALGVLDTQVKNDIFSCGANVVMKKVTPEAYRKDYEIYPASFTAGDMKTERLELEEDIRRLGRIPL